MKMERESHKNESNLLKRHIEELQRELQAVKVSVPCMQLALQCYHVLLFMISHRPT
jgi:hypothetical protein